jgi:hypothetical protein
MRNQLSHYASNAVAFFIAGASLAGCTSSGSQVTPSGPMQQSAVRSDMSTNAEGVAPSLQASLSGEVFTASQVTVKTKECGDPRLVDFSASGKTRGPYPGRFVAHGSWSWAEESGHGGWGFNESFTITSGKRTFSGKASGGNDNGSSGPTHCTTFGPTGGPQSGLKYKSESVESSGIVSFIHIRSGYLKEKLH